MEFCNSPNNISSLVQELDPLTFPLNKQKKKKNEKTKVIVYTY